MTSGVSSHTLDRCLEIEANIIRNFFPTNEHMEAFFMSSYKPIVEIIYDHLKYVDNDPEIQEYFSELKKLRILRK